METFVPSGGSATGGSALVIGQGTQLIVGIPSFNGGNPLSSVWYVAVGGSQTGGNAVFVGS